MPLTYHWQDDAKTIFRCNLVGDWSWNEYDQMVDHVTKTIREVGHDVSIITDITQSAKMPKGSPMQHLRKTKDAMPPNVKTMITVGKYSLFASAILNAFLKVYSQKRIRMQLVATEAEAQQLLRTPVAISD
jgi:hypothetical protein